MRFVHVAQCTQRESALTQYLVELSLYDVGFLRHPMSLIAASALFMSLVILRSRREEIWTKTIAHFTEYEEVSLVPVVHALTILHNSFLDFFPSPSESQVFCKYELASWQNVSAITALIPGDVSARFSTAMASAMWMEIIQKKRGVI